MLKSQTLPKSNFLEIKTFFYEYRVSEKFEVNLELSEISEAVWTPLKELDLQEIAFDSQKIFFEKYLQSK